MIRRNKYNAKPSEFNGRKYASKAERDRAAELHGMLDRGEVQLVLEQPPVLLTRALKDSIRYIPDFLVIDAAGEWWFEDVKGMLTPEFKLKMKLWRQNGPGALRLLMKRARGWKTDIVIPDSAARSS